MQKKNNSYMLSELFKFHKNILGYTSATWFCFQSVQLKPEIYLSKL